MNILIDSTLHHFYDDHEKLRREFLNLLQGRRLGDLPIALAEKYPDFRASQFWVQYQAGIYEDCGCGEIEHCKFQNTLT